MKSVLKFFFYVYAFLGTGVYLLSCLAPFVNPTHANLLYFSGLGFPIILVNFIVIALYFGVIKKKFTFLFLLVPGFIFGLNYLSTGKGKIDETKGLNIYSFNTFSDRLLHADKEAYTSWIDYVKTAQNNPDIICLQEHHSKVENIFPNTAHFNTWTYKRSNLKIATHYTIIHGGEIKDSSGLRFAIFADIKIQQDTIRVYTFHLQSNKISTMLETAEKADNPGADRLLRGGEKLRNTIYTAAKKRAMQAKKLRWHMNACLFPIVACGDMNETAQSFAYRQLKGQLYDTFRKGELGMHPTYIKNPSWVRIDYIFTDPSLELLSYQVPQFEISDHRPVQVAIKMKDKK